MTTDEKIQTAIRMLQDRVKLLGKDKKVLVLNKIDVELALMRIAQLEDENEILRSAAQAAPATTTSDKG